MGDWLVLAGAHYIADFPLQGTFLAQMKGKRLYVLFVHAMIYALTVAAALAFVGRYADWKFFAVLVTHAAIDYWKSHKPADDAHWHLIYYDQTAHLAINAALYLLPRGAV